MKRKREKIKIVSGAIGEGVHAMLRKMGHSNSANVAWHMIKEMPDEEWGAICDAVAKEIIYLLEDEEEKDEIAHL